MFDKNDKEFYGKKRTRNERSYKVNIIKKSKCVSISVIHTKECSYFSLQSKQCKKNYCRNEK